MDVVVLADTHLRGGLDRLPRRVHDAIVDADAVVHAGDLVSRLALDELRRSVLVHAVLGNNDTELAGHLPSELEVELGGVRVAVVHDSGPRTGRAARMARRFPDAQVVVFGHSHVPVDGTGVNGKLLFNPGSPTQRRSQPFPSFGRLRLDSGRVVEHTIELLTLPAR